MAASCWEWDHTESSRTNLLALETVDVILGFVGV